MKTPKLIIGRSAVALVGASAILTAAFALESQNNTPGSAPAVTVDLKPLDRTSRLPASFSDIIKKVTPAVVKIEVTGHAVPAAQFGDLNGQDPFGDMQLPPGLRRFFEQRGQQPQGGQRHQQQPRGHGSASGVIVTPDGYILTNNHVVDEAGKVDITLHDGRKFTAKVVGTDPKSDLAVVKIDTTGLPAIAFADSSAAEVGDVVLAAGNPFGLGESVTLGMISAVGRASMGLDYEDFIQTDAAINPGNSGGALVDAQGRLVGINTAIYSRSGGNDGIGFAIPANMVRSIMNDLISGGQVNRGYLGVMIQDLTPALASEFKAPADTRGALVSDVPAKSPASKAGLESGDIITSLNNQPVKDARGLKLAVATHKPGDTATLQVLRDGSVKTLTATLAEQPGAAKAQPAKHKVGQASEGTLNGVAVADLNKEARQEYKIPADVQGALITDVQEDSPSWEAGLRPGDVIQQIDRKPVSSAEEAANLTEAPATEATLVKVWSRGGSRFVSVDETAKEKGVS